MWLVAFLTLFFIRIITYKIKCYNLFPRLVLLHILTIIVERAPSLYHERSYCKMHEASSSHFYMGLEFTLCLNVSSFPDKFIYKGKGQFNPQTINFFHNCKFIFLILHTKKKSPYSIIINDFK